MRLIDADALEKEGWRLHRTIRVDKNTDEYQTKSLIQIPTIEPERKTGRWILVNDNNGQHFVCEFCGEWRYHTQQKYCGECGAKLSLKVEHE